jgi:hypothetical protein
LHIVERRRCAAQHNWLPIDRLGSIAPNTARVERLDESIARYMAQLETADRRGDAVPEARILRFKDKITKLREEIARLSAIDAEMIEERGQANLVDRS